MLLKAAAALALVATLAACGSAKKAAAPLSGLPPGCSVAEVNGIVTDFLAQPSFAPPSSFEVYATYESDGRKFLARRAAPALAHLRTRLRLGEQSRLIELRVAKQDFNHARITFQLTRHASDYVGRGIHSRLVRGGGTVDCAHQRIAAWVTKGP